MWSSVRGISGGLSYLSDQDSSPPTFQVPGHHCFGPKLLYMTVMEAAEILETLNEACLWKFSVIQVMVGVPANQGTPWTTLG